MASGDIITTQLPAPELNYSRTKALEVITPGQAVGFDAAGDMIKALVATGGPIKILSNLTKPDNDSRAYMMSGTIEAEAGGVIQPNSFVCANADSKLIAWAAQSHDKIIGVYLRLVSDEEGNPTASADESQIIVRVTV